MASENEPSLKKSTNEKKLGNLWESVTCGQLAGENNRKLISIGSNDSVVKACEILAEHGISSAPIVDRERNMLLGVFDFRDLAACLLNVVGSLDVEEVRKGNWSLKDVLKHEKAELASDLSQHDKFHSVQSDAPLLSAVQYFGLGQHRVFVLDKEKAIKGVLSQSDALKFLDKHMDDTGLGLSTIESLGVIRPREQVVHVPDDQSVLQALKLMQSHGVSSLCVTRGGALAGNFSMGDVKYLLKLGRLSTLLQPLKAVLQNIRLAKDHERKHESQVPTFTTTPDMCFGKAVGRLVATRSHRLWVIDSQRQVHGLMSLSDVLRTLTPKKARDHWKEFPLISFVPAV
jgi:CBS-domain-containing membrane protein